MKREYNEPQLTISTFCSEGVETNSSMPIAPNSNQSDARNWIESKFTDENLEKLTCVIYF